MSQVRGPDRSPGIRDPWDPGRGVAGLPRVAFTGHRLRCCDPPPASAPPVLPLLLSPRHPSSIFFPKHSSNCLTALVPTSVEPTHLLEQVQSPQPSLPSHLTSCQPHPPHLPSQNLSSASCICCPPSQAEHLLAHSSSRHFSLIPCCSLLYSPSLDSIFPLT